MEIGEVDTEWGIVLKLSILHRYFILEGQCSYLYEVLHWEIPRYPSTQIEHNQGMSLYYNNQAQQIMPSIIELLKHKN